MTDYASKTEDPEIKKLFQDAADSAMKNKQELMKFCNLSGNLFRVRNGTQTGWKRYVNSISYQA